MSLFLIRCNVNVGKRGFSESVYFESTSTKLYDDVYSAALALGYHRQALTPSSVNVYSISWQQIEGAENLSDVIYAGSPIISNKPLIALKPEPVTVGAIVRLRAGASKRGWLFRGVPDNYVVSQYPKKNAAINPTYVTAINNFLDWLITTGPPLVLGQPQPIEGDFGMVTFADTANDLGIFNIAVGSTPTTTAITTIQAHGLVLGNRVRVLGLNQLVYPCILDSWFVSNVVDATTFEIRYTLPANAPVYNSLSGRVRPLVRNFSAFTSHDDATQNIFTSRDTGKAHGTPRGRDSARRC